MGSWKGRRVLFEIPRRSCHFRPCRRRRAETGCRLGRGWGGGMRLAFAEIQPGPEAGTCWNEVSWELSLTWTADPSQKPDWAETRKDRPGSCGRQMVSNSVTGLVATLSPKPNIRLSFLICISIPFPCNPFSCPSGLTADQPRTPVYLETCCNCRTSSN